ncbi:MAG: zf-HC2 domain-containing protein [Planctomycetota bacterium]|nr:zf-HC2 domain-containing protein [Planctomycetota bacterium]
MGRCVAGKMLSCYLDDRLPPAMAARVGAHLAECAACARALDEMRSVDDVVRKATVPSAEVPDLAGRVTEDLSRRGAFLAARVAAGKRRLFGEVPVARAAGVLAAAAVLLVAVFIGLDRLSCDRWSRRAAPVVADAERVLVRLVYVEAPQEASRLAWARDETRKLALSSRLAETRQGAAPSLADDLAYLEEAFARLADGQPLPPALWTQLSDGEALQRVAHLRDWLADGG